MLTPDYQIDLRWLHTISHRLPRFKKHGGRGTFAARCIICGDSKRNSKITRLYFYTKGNSLNFDCKNCGAHGSFYKFMQLHVSEQFEEYKRDQVMSRLEVKSKQTKPKKRTTTPKPEKKRLDRLTGLSDCVWLTELDDDHIAIKYVKSRGMTETEYKHLMYTNDFLSVMGQVDKQILATEENRKKYQLFKNEPRLIIPFYSEDGKDIVMIQGRSFDKKTKLRYVSIKKDESIDKIYGLERIDKSKPVYVVEGPLDSLFIDNCIAVGDANLTRVDADVYCWDNQPRSKEIVEYMEKAIQAGKSVVVYPLSPNKKMDINDIILMGMDRREVNHLLSTHVFKGIRAKLELTRWRRI